MCGTGDYIMLLNLMDHNLQRIIFGKVPGIGAKLFGHLFNNAFGTIEVKGPLPMKNNPQYLIETHEMIHVEMTDEDGING
jgi:hypothetical protein